MKNTGKLILTIKKYPILYDHNHSEHKNIRAKEKIWMKIGEELNESSKELKKKWKNLKDTYARYIRGNKTKSAKSLKKFKKWLWADLMKEFRPFLFIPQKANKITSCTGTSVNGDENGEDTSKLQGELIKLVESIKRDHDAVDALMLAHAKTIKMFSGKRQVVTKMKIAQVIMEQELLHEEELASSLN